MRILLLTLLLAVVALAGCTDSEDNHCDDGHADAECPENVAISEPTGPVESTGPMTYFVDVEDNAFNPEALSLNIGDSIIWNHTGSNPHTVTAADGAFDSHPDCNSFVDGTLGNCMATGDSFEFKFDTAGDFIVYCKLHGSSDGSGHAMTVSVA